MEDGFFQGRKEEEGRGEAMRSCWGKGSGKGIGDPDEMPEQGRAAGDWAGERGSQGSLGGGWWPLQNGEQMGKGPDPYALAKGPFPLASVLLLAASNPDLTEEGLFPSA